MTECAGEMVQPWEARTAASDGGVALVDDVEQRFVELTADVISHTAFGSNYDEGKEVSVAQRELQYIAFSIINNVRVPGL
ncbi:hypothetical protein D1007_58001 [Hordeum vulgare]|nr:hypothetical protein D1007_58001 [Hordeum vulgare]